ncbi:hypothetical protein FACS189499_03810 [Clostridia bacterium]|nr:hypothetical protein FACS189499_03810 [Clostridia bacterium]
MIRIIDGVKFSSAEMDNAIVIAINNGRGRHWQFEEIKYHMPSGYCECTIRQRAMKDAPTMIYRPVFAASPGELYRKLVTRGDETATAPQNIDGWRAQDWADMIGAIDEDADDCAAKIDFINRIFAAAGKLIAIPPKTNND